VAVAGVCYCCILVAISDHSPRACSQCSSASAAHLTALAPLASCIVLFAASHTRSIDSCLRLYGDTGTAEER
jgi:hypothetical protein